MSSFCWFLKIWLKSSTAIFLSNFLGKNVNKYMYYWVHMSTVPLNCSTCSVHLMVQEANLMGHSWGNSVMKTGSKHLFWQSQNFKCSLTFVALLGSLSFHDIRNANMKAPKIKFNPSVLTDIFLYEKERKQWDKTDFIFFFF